MKRILFIAALCVIAGTTMIGCSRNSSYTPPPATQVMFAHLSARNPALDFYAGTTSLEKVVTGLNYKSSSKYLSAISGAYAILADTTTQGNDNYPVVAQYVQLGGGNGNTMYIVDSSAAVTRAVITVDNLTVPGADSAGIRFLHFAPDVNKLDVYVRGESTPDFSGRDFLYRQTNDANVASLTFSRFKQGTYTISFRQAGTSTELLSLPVTLTGGKLYTLFTSGFAAQAGTPKAFNAGLVAHEAN